MNRIMILAIISFIASVNKIWSQEQAMMMSPVAEAKIYFSDKPFTVTMMAAKPISTLRGLFMEDLSWKNKPFSRHSA